MKSERNGLQSIVEQADIPDEWKIILQKTFASLEKRNDLVVDEIRKRVLGEDENRRNDWSNRWNIITALVSVDIC